jgi:diacylglycerol O-acyltransferase
MENRRNAKVPMSSLDTVLLRMEHPTHPMIVTGVLIFGGPLDYTDLKTLLKQRLLHLDRFGQRVGQPWLNGSRPYWEPDPNLDLDAHLVRVTLDPPRDQAALQALVSRLASTPLDLCQAPWQFHLVEEYGAGSALICRVHHSIADGIALAYTLLSLTDPDPDAALMGNPGEGVCKDDRHTAERQALPEPPALRAMRWMVQETRKTLADPAPIRRLVRLGARGAAALGRLVLRWPDPASPFKGLLSTEKRVAWSEPVALADVKVIGQGFGATVNDVLLSAITGALRRYIQSQEVLADTKDIRPGPVDDFRAVIPVNLRSMDAVPTLDNQFGSVFVALPLGVSDPVERLRETKRRMDDLKGSLEAPVTFGLLNLVGYASPSVQELAVRVLETKATAVVSNVIGPQESIYLTGVPLKAIVFLLPHTARLGLGISILSYAGQVRLGVITDAGLAPDPERIIEGFDTEFDQLLQRAREWPKAPRIEQMVAKLDEAIQTLGGVLERMESDQTIEKAKGKDKDGDIY